VARLQTAYLEALARLSAGDWPAARTAVSDVESQGLASGTPDEALIRAQLEVALDVSGERPDHLLPLVQLHEELYVENRRTQRFRLAAHARRVTQWLVELYAEHSSSVDAGGVAAGALVSLAGHLLRGGNSLEGMAVLERALEHDPRHATALLTLASGYEILGEYKKTVDLLRRYLEVRPDSAEGKLRLAVNLARLGSPKPALGLLGEAVAAGEPAWVVAVAYEELASLLAEQGRPEAAVARLRQALERFPGEQRLYIQLAAILDRSGQRVEARAALAELERRLLQQTGRGVGAAAGSEEGSPRLRYSQWPLADLEDNRRAFLAYASSRLSGFAEAVMQRTGQGDQGP
jgi:tetratricopeptide (TPR) repeat protein